MKAQKGFKANNMIASSHKTLGTSLIYSPMSPSSLVRKRNLISCSEEINPLVSKSIEKKFLN